MLSAWKLKYGYSSNDPRYYTATMNQILDDLLEDAFIEHLKEFGQSKILEDIIAGRERDGDFDNKYNKEFKKNLLKAIKNAGTHD